MVSGIVRPAKNEHLLARIIQRVFEPGPADGFSGNESADRKLLRHQHAFQRADGMGQDKSVVAVDEVFGCERV